MRRTFHILIGLLALVLVLPLLLIASLNTVPGQRGATALVNRVAGGTVAISGLSGRFPDRLRLAHVALADAAGTYASLDGIALDWAPLALLHRGAVIDRLAVERIAVARRPAPAAGSTAPASGGTSSLPLRVELRALHVARLDIAAPVAGMAAAFAADGAATLADLTTGQAELSLRRLDSPGTYRVGGHIDPAALAATLAADEPADGLIARLGGLPGLGALAISGTIDGPWTGAATKLAISAGPLRLAAAGSVNVTGQAADLDLTARAPVMTPRPDLSWRHIAVDAHVHGAFTRPQVRAQLRLDDLAAAGAALRRLTVEAHGDLGQVTLNAAVDGLRLPGPRPELLEAAPLTLAAQAQLDAPGRPVNFTLAHQLLRLTGRAETAGTPRVTAHLDLPDLAPLAAAGGADIAGHAALDLTGEMNGVSVDGTIGITGGMAPLPALLGPEAHIGLAATRHGDDIALSRLSLDGATASFAAQGGITGGIAGLDWRATLTDLSVLAATLRGRIDGHGHIAGKTDNLSAQATLSGDVATPGDKRGLLTLSLDAEGLPAAPKGHLSARGTLDGAALTLDAAATRDTDGTLRLALTGADWNSAHAEGALTLAPGATLPLGKVSLRMQRLSDLSRLLGKTLSGSITADAETTQDAGPPVATVTLDARDAGLPSTATLGRATLRARVRDPMTAPALSATLDVAGLHAGVIGGSARLAANGKPGALGITVQTAVQGLAGSDLTASAAATLDVPASRVTLATLSADWQGQTLRLLAPAHVSYAGGVTVDRVRLGVQQARLDLTGRLSPTLDLTASLANVSADLARAIVPDLKASGVLNAEARLTGPPSLPTGTAYLAATGLHLNSGPVAGLPPANLTATAKLAGTTADIDARFTAGGNRITLSGSAPLDPAAAMRLRGQGAIDLTTLNPLLQASGRRARGLVTLDATVTGTLAAPRAVGSLLLAHGDVQDFVLGAHLSELAARIEGDGDTIRIASLTGRAGQGSITALGSVGLAGAMPVDLRLTARHARPLASDTLTATLDAELALHGDLKGALAADGSVTIDEADIRIPDRLPASVPVLDVQRPGQEPPPPTASGPDIALDIAVRAPGQVFIRGRGLFAEVAGRIEVGGTAAAPVPTGVFRLRRGDFNLAGSALTFTSGDIRFEGSGKLDPALNLIATSTNGSIAATLTVGGFASAPKITLSSFPPLPQDEVLAQLLFHQSASTLTPVQLASAAAALAQISGAGGGVFDPLNAVRQTLGLDRLNVGGGQNGTGTSVEAGRYVARGVYVGARQSADGNGSQATVQIDLLRGLKLETDVGTGSTASATGAAATTDPYGTSVGLTYQFQY